MLYIDAKYVSLISYKLRNFKKKNDYYWNFSCPICGDSKKNPLKARGYIFKTDNRLVYKCHNCGVSTNVGNLIKQLDPIVYNEYVLERYKENTSSHNDHIKLQETTVFVNPEPILYDSILDKLQRVDNLSTNHPAKQYIINRKIPEDKWNLFYFAPKFKTWSNSIKYQFTNLENDTPRLVIPFFNDHGKCFMYQGRAFGKEQPKYISIKLDEKEEKVFGMDRLDYSKRVYVVEGPIDSIFVPNSIAIGGAGFDIPFTEAIKTNATLIMDNEPRSNEICKYIEKLIENNYSVCLWPDTIQEKDINEMILAGKSINQIMETINTNTFQGMEAKLKFTEWRKC
jgi:transcription elongation factor Elf1